MMDYYALRCDQYDFLLNLYQQWEVREGAAVQTEDIECKYYWNRMSCFYNLNTQYSWNIIENNQNFQFVDLLQWYWNSEQWPQVINNTVVNKQNFSQEGWTLSPLSMFINFFLITLTSVFSPPGKTVFAINSIIYYLRPLVTTSISLKKVHGLKILIFFFNLYFVFKLKKINFYFIIKDTIMSIYNNIIANITLTMCWGGKSQH